MTKYRWQYCLLFLALVLAVFANLYYHGVFGQRLTLTKTSYAQLRYWQQDNHQAALQAFQQSCSEIMKRKPAQRFSQGQVNAGLVTDWQLICTEALKLRQPDAMAARLFFETWFDPYYVKNHLNPKGKFTGYYLPLLHGSLKQDNHYNVPVYAIPEDLIKVNLGAFTPTLSGRAVIGRLKGNALIPYPDRAAINKGAIRDHASVLVWVDSQIDLFFAQIQGSALVALTNGQQILMGYGAANGHRYTAIGGILIAKNQISKHEMSMQNIRSWLQAHSDQAEELLDQNASYVFFRKLPSLQPLGIEQVTLTPERSLAIDMRYLPIGAPVWVDTSISAGNRTNVSYQHLLIAQDTGSAIKGMIRGDIYFGPGESAEQIAGHLNQEGRYWVLLPKNIHINQGIVS